MKRKTWLRKLDEYDLAKWLQMIQKDAVEEGHYLGIDWVEWLKKPHEPTWKEKLEEAGWKREASCYDRIVYMNHDDTICVEKFGTQTYSGDFDIEDIEFLKPLLEECRKEVGW